MSLFNNLKERIKRAKAIEEEYFLARAIEGDVCCLTPISHKDFVISINKFRIHKPKFKRYTIFNELFFKDWAFLNKKKQKAEDLI